MALRGRDIQYGSRIQGNDFTFGDEGDVLEWHNHVEEETHLVIVAKGRVLLETRGEAVAPIVVDHNWIKKPIQGDGGSVILEEGDLVDIPGGIDHQFTAMVGGSRMFTLLKEPVQEEE